MKIKLILLSVFVSFSFVNAQMYTPSGTIQGDSGNSNLGVGTSLPSRKVTVQGDHHDSSILIHSVGGGDELRQSDLMLWASEPGLSWTGAGIGNNVQNWSTGTHGISLINPVRGGSYMRFLDNAISLNVISPSAGDKQVLSINGKGDIGIGTENASNDQGWDKVLDIAGARHSKILATAENSLYKVGFFAHPESWYGGGGFVGTESNHPLHFITNYSAKMSILTNGNVGIGLINPQNKLDVNGTIHSKEVKVDMTGWSDFVFKKDYTLPTLQEVEKHIAEKGHLENMPTEEEVLKNGINLGEMNSKLLQKIEELTLYVIEQNKTIEDLKKEVKNIKSKI